MRDPGIPETGHWQAMRARAETTLSFDGRADCLDHAKEHARDVLTLEADRERLRAALGVVGRMAIYGPGAGTTEAQTLATIAAYVEKRLARE